MTQMIKALAVFICTDNALAEDLCFLNADNENWSDFAHVQTYQSS